jgi:hypothetical protein
LCTGRVVQSTKAWIEKGYDVTVEQTWQIEAVAELKATRIDGCRACGSHDLLPVLDLGDQPLANGLRAARDLDRPEPRFPLALVRCESCSLVEILDSVPPEALFGDYPYFSSVIKALVAHAHALAVENTDRFDLGPDSLVVEIASNDGYLLQHYRDAGIPILGVEPARNIAPVARERGIPTRCEFFGSEVAQQMVAEGIQPDVVHAHNVLAHVPELGSFVDGLRTLLQGGGVGVVEVPYVKNLIDDCEFDTIYHEHLCYFSLTAIDRLLRLHRLELERVERIAIHGGSLRLFIRAAGRARPDGTARALLEEEEEWGVDEPGAYREFGDAVMAMKSSLRAMLEELKRDGARIAAYGAAAKGSTLLNTFEIGAETLDFVADASPHKQGHYMPGTALEVRPPEALVDERPDYVLLLAWNFADEILAQQHAYRAGGGRFIVPVPEPHVV